MPNWPPIGPPVRFLRVPGAGQKPLAEAPALVLLPTPRREFSAFVGNLSSEVDDLSLYTAFHSRFSSVKAAKGEGPSERSEDQEWVGKADTGFCPSF